MGKVSTVNAKNVFSNGVLVSFRGRGWGGTANAPQELFEDKDNFKHTQLLLDDQGRDMLSAILSERTRAKNYIKANSVPFPVDGLFFIPLDRVELVNERLEAYKQRHDEFVEDFVKAFNTLKNNYRKKYPEDYRPEKYPSKDQLNYRFQFSWSFRKFDVPDAELKAVSPSIYKDEIRKFKDDVDSMKSMTIDLVGKALLDRVNALSKQCDTGKINSATVNSIAALLDKVDDLFKGFVTDKALNDMLAEVRAYMDGTDADMLKYDDSFRELVKEKMDTVADTLENKTLRRAIVL